ncbi:hypothetical protein Leryth_027227 [Lithospermum erythrorhizon]|nr:hypothetical protein Leryth_027227 [Lithospermum erythrorhizon]
MSHQFFIFPWKRRSIMKEQLMALKAMEPTLILWKSNFDWTDIVSQHNPESQKKSRFLPENPPKLREVEGLQVLKDEQWYSVPIIPNAILVNLGDQAEIMSISVILKS